MKRNICKFVATKNISESLNIINFVYEKECAFEQKPVAYATYSVNLVMSGNGVLHTTHGDFAICDGDLFFTFSADPYYIESTENLEYIYISFIGSRAPALYERMEIRKSEQVFHGFGFLKERWEDTFICTVEATIDLFCEGLLLHTLGYISRQLIESSTSGKTSAVLAIKRYIDTHFADSEITLSNICSLFNYNTRYVSTAFKKTVKMGFAEYVFNLRMKYAVTLIEGGMACIKDIAELSGYNDSLYFSKVFKRKYGISPKKYIMNERTLNS